MEETEAETRKKENLDNSNKGVKGTTKGNLYVP